MSSNADRRVLWLELLAAIQGGLNRDPLAPVPSPTEVPYSKRKDFHVTKIDSVFMDDVAAKWFTDDAKKKYGDQWKARVDNLELYKDIADEAERRKKADEDLQAELTKVPLAGKGWVIELEGFHFHNGIPGEEKEEHVYAKSDSLSGNGVG